ncbi:hypothetical protein BZA05DRAFT_418683 [Tricharina praecox]|uniref:uncharacterized protein n=1 Tax=Tricharina praecox TaxID=43433 RepID=UPI00221E6C11|nr:uncharacterized protein BZA05DRAFT_418683 [Tricharina praecox]KAI5851779.1 hypothetical protein BZA05DRAFT_418683 [Tricharina praecox]
MGATISTPPAPSLPSSSPFFLHLLPPTPSITSFTHHYTHRHTHRYRIPEEEIPAEEAAYADYLQIVALTALYLLAISEEKDGAAAEADAADEQQMEIDEEDTEGDEIDIDEDEDEGY